MLKSALIVAAVVVVGSLAIVAVAFHPGVPTPAQPPSGQGGERFDVTIPTIEIAWARVGGDIVITVTRADPPKPLDCRWATWVFDITNGNALGFGINLTNGVEPLGPPPGGGVCTRTDPGLEFSDANGDHMLSAGDRWVLHDIPEGTEWNLEFVLTYWGMQDARFRWGEPGTQAP